LKHDTTKVKRIISKINYNIGKNTKNIYIMMMLGSKAPSLAP